MEYGIVIGLTSIVFCFIIYIVVKINNALIKQKSLSELKHRQSTLHNAVKLILPTNEEIIKSIIMNREKSKQVKQSGQNYNSEKIKVVVIDNKAYWIQNNTFYNTIITEDGEIDQSLAKPVDTTNMEIEEIDRLMKIVDDLRGIEKNDGSGTGN
jgi:protein-tyrosine phosphatase